MGKYTWIKIFTEIVHDPKIQRLPVYLRWRFVELCCLAGEHGHGGALQPVEEMAWVLRSSTDEVVKSLRSLAEIGVVQESQPGNWMVVNFEKRQSRMSENERQQRFRAGEAKPQKNPRARSQVNEEVSQISHNFVTEEEEEVEEILTTTTRGQPPKPSKAFSAFEQNIGAITSMTKDWLIDIEETYSEGWVLAAISEAVSNNARKQSYIDAVLRRWKVEGFQSPKQKQTFSNSRRKGKMSMEEFNASLAQAIATHPEL